MKVHMWKYSQFVHGMEEEALSYQMSRKHIYIVDGFLLISNYFPDLEIHKTLCLRDPDLNSVMPKSLPREVSFGDLGSRTFLIGLVALCFFKLKQDPPATLDRAL